MSAHDLHLDPEALALLALGERPAVADAASFDAHLHACGACRSELDELSAVARTARSTTSAQSLVPPPAHVWDAISAELDDDADRAGAAVVSIERARRPRRWIPLAAAASVGLLLGAGTVAALSGEQEPNVSIVASTTLDPLADSGASGSVKVVETAAGARVDVDMTGLSQGPGFFEVWLLSEDATRLISLGVLDSSSQGSFVVPPGVSTADYPIVDVSLEPEDGDPTHSKNSLARGTLPA